MRKPSRHQKTTGQHAQQWAFRKQNPRILGGAGRFRLKPDKPNST